MGAIRLLGLWFRFRVVHMDGWGVLSRPGIGSMVALIVFRGWKMRGDESHGT